jgi:hypothetical protein
MEDEIYKLRLENELQGMRRPFLAKIMAVAERDGAQLVDEKSPLHPL